MARKIFLIACEFPHRRAGTAGSVRPPGVPVAAQAAAAVLSVPLASMSEGVVLQLGSMIGTPGLLISSRQVPSSADHGFEAMAKDMNVALTVDARIWFAVRVLAITVAIVRSRGRTRSTVRGIESELTKEKSTIPSASIVGEITIALIHRDLGKPSPSVTTGKMTLFFHGES
jgi:hypothetical protein